MHRRGIAGLVLVAALAAGCGGSLSKGAAQDGVALATVKQKDGLIRYDLDNPILQTADVVENLKGMVQFDLKTSANKIWIMRTLGRKTDLAAFNVSGQARVPFTQVDDGEDYSLSTVSWLATGDQVVVLRSDFNHFGESKVKLIQVYPEPRKEVSVSPRQVGQLVTASKSGLYVVGFDRETLVELDRDFQVRASYKVKGGVGNVLPLDDKQLLIGNALYDLEKQDFYWDEAGATKRTIDLRVSGKVVTIDPSGGFWSANYGEVGGRLRIVGASSDGKVQVDKIVAHHDLDPTAPIVLMASERSLVAATIGYYQGERKLLIYTFKRH